MFGLAVDYRKVLAFLVAAGAVALIIVFKLPVVAAVLPFFLALILANVLDPVVLWLQTRARLPRPVATLVALGTALFIVGYSALWILSNLYREVVELAATLPTYEKFIGRLATDIVEQATEIFESLPSDWIRFFRERIDVEIDGVLTTSVDILKSLTAGFLEGIASLPVVLVTGVITMLATYFFTTDKETVDTNLLRAVPLRLRPTLAELRDKILIDLVGFFKAQFVLFFINTALAALWLFLMGARYWMLLSLVLGILDVIPILGPGLVLMPWAAIGLWQGDVALAVKLVALFGAMFGVRQVLQVKILGDSVGIHPLLMLFALWSGIVMFGVWGFLIGPVIVIFGKAIWNTGLIPYFRDDPALTDPAVMTETDPVPVAGAEPSPPPRSEPEADETPPPKIPSGVERRSASAPAAPPPSETT